MMVNSKKSSEIIQNWNKNSGLQHSQSWKVRLIKDGWHNLAHHQEVPAVDLQKFQAPFFFLILKRENFAKKKKSYLWPVSECQF